MPFHTKKCISRFHKPGFGWNNAYHSLTYFTTISFCFRSSHVFFHFFCFVNSSSSSSSMGPASAKHVPWRHSHRHRRVSSGWVLNPSSTPLSSGGCCFVSASRNHGPQCGCWLMTMTPLEKIPRKLGWSLIPSRICHGFNTVRISVLAQNPRGVFCCNKGKKCLMCVN